MKKEFQMNGNTYEVECIHSGQYHPYGDTFRVFEIITSNKDPMSILNVMKEMFGYDVPLKKDWNSHDCYCYFKGYCEISTINGGFKYTKCEPYTD